MDELGGDLFIQQWRLELFMGKFNRFLKDMEKYSALQEFLDIKTKEYDNLGKPQDASE